MDSKKATKRNTVSNMEPSELARAIHNYVNTAIAVVDLLQILRFTNLEDLKAFCHGQIDKLKDSDLRSAHYSALPINTVLPDDLMQHVLSFQDSHAKIQSRVICKKWNRLHKLNEENMLRSLYRSFNDKYPNPLPMDNDTWIWYEVRTVLHPIERRLRFRGPLHSLKEVHTKCRSGDRVLVHHTVRDSPETDYFLMNPFVKDIRLIGLHPVRSDQHQIVFNDFYLIGHLTLHNLTVYAKALDVGHRYADRDWQRDEPALAMRGCDLRTDTQISVKQGASLDMQHCTLKCQSQQNSWDKMSAIEVSPWAKKVDIRHNTIKGFHRGISIQRHVELGTDNLVEMNVEENSFEDISEYAVVERTMDHQDPKIKGTDRCTLRGNTGSSSQFLKTDPNVLYHIDE